MNTLPNQIVDTIASVIGDQSVPLHAPYFGGQEAKYVAQCVETGWVSSVGSFVDQFERMLCDITGAKYAVAVSNGTSGLLVALQLAGVRPGDEVLVPAMTFVATANAVSHLHAIPHLVEIESEQLGLDPEKLGDYLAEITEVRNGVTINRTTGRPITAIVPMHAFGHPCKIQAIIAVVDRFGIAVVEDAAESLGSKVAGQHTGTFGRLGMISFNGNKIATTGGGGVILTDDDELGPLAKHLTTTAKVPHAWEFFHDQVGYNFRMPNLNAALGCGQLEQLDHFLASKRNLAARYRDAFSTIDGVRFVDQPTGTESNFWLAAIVLDQDQLKERDSILTLANSRGIGLRPAWQLMNDLPMYCDNPAMDLAVAKQVQASLINLPSGVQVAIDSPPSSSPSQSQSQNR
ncbi:Putative pyridoxal phosphate-dependent aminotransferase EpsN [Rubripirellula lacrimiformis]|uniref:Pyridoxal phosphate-dependent aminotransferase EpsN n=1 Tax=Rubripirellula lacrimiformis TaxID=1930273 RepID=A0A517N8N8_9BACT|nr:LegC family aminotransferase [Rubripirellula lacrimiformis]QDT03506.1 Putative pyridoxal phosphate-dependent aminotransferase EpsN [Rubripirellula lacrimiformis]